MPILAARILALRAGLATDQEPIDEFFTIIPLRRPSRTELIKRGNKPVGGTTLTRRPIIANFSRTEVVGLTCAPRKTTVRPLSRAKR